MADELSGGYEEGDYSKRNDGEPDRRMVDERELDQYASGSEPGRAESQDGSRDF